MKTLIMLTMATIILTGCGKGQQGASSENTEATSVVARTVSESEYTQNYLSMVREPKADNSIMSLIIPKAFADGFVNLEPFFVPYYTSFNIPTNKNDCDSLDSSYNAVYCTSTNLSLLVTDKTATGAKNALKDALTIYPRIATTNYSGGLNETNSIVRFVEGKYYHLSIARRGGGVYTNQAVTVELVKYDGGAFVSADASYCGVSIENSAESQAKGDLIILADTVTANSGNYYSPSFTADGNASSDTGACFFNVYGTFAGVTLSQSEGKKIRIGEILDTDASNVYPDIYNGTVTFNGEDITATKITILYDEFEQKEDNSGSTYKYGTWTVATAAGSSAITDSYWQFTCGGGGSTGRWFNTSATTAPQWNANHVIKAYDDYYDINVDTAIDSNDALVSDVKKFYWRVGGCQEMLMMVSVKDANNIMVQRKIAMISE